MPIRHLVRTGRRTGTFIKSHKDLRAERAVRPTMPFFLIPTISSAWSGRITKGWSKLDEFIQTLSRTWMNPDWTVHTMPVPHLMFYAPNLTNEDIGAVPNSDHSFPFIFKEGIAEQSYIVHLVGGAEKAKIMAGEQALLDDLCAYREFLCLPSKLTAPNDDGNPPPR
jgi:hypothetical protein